ncbi:MAG: 8-oxoguanine deaminase, partial [Candidatus Puniceispirillum sp.]|nr:8-oxoguanine deaminase [Candidatus Puniceispirillum sp.]
MSGQTLLIKNADVLCTMAPSGHDNPGDMNEIQNGGLFIRDGVIEHVAKTSQLPKSADTVLDLTGHIVIPGMVNTHHHLFQNLTRAVPAAQNVPLFGWLQTLYP